MAVASLELSYTYCLDQVKEACDLIEKGEASNAAFILCSVRDDAKLIQKQSKTYYKGLQRLETVQQKRMEHLTEKINDLYNEEERYSKQESELGIQKQVYIQARESEEASKMAAERRYRDAEREKEKHLKEQRERDEKGKNFWWVPGYNLYLVFEDLIEDNRQKARDASREMENHQRKIRDSEREIDKLSDKEAKARNDIEACIKKQSDAKHERNNLHDKLGATKEMIVLVLKAAEFWDDIASLCDSASMKSENLASVMRSAASKMENTVKILRSSGTQTLVGSFKDSWQEIEEMIRTNDLVIAEEDCPAECILGLQGFLEFGQRGMVTISVDSRTLTLNSIAILMAFVAFFGCFSVIQGTYLTIHSIAVGLAIFIAKIVGGLYSIVYFIIYIFWYLVYLLYVILGFVISFKIVKVGALLASVGGAVYACKHGYLEKLKRKLQSMMLCQFVQNAAPKSVPRKCATFITTLSG